MKIQVQDQNQCGIGQARIESYYLLGFAHIRHHHRSLPTVPKHCGLFHQKIVQKLRFYCVKKFSLGLISIARALERFYTFAQPILSLKVSQSVFFNIYFLKNHLTMVQDYLTVLG